MNFVARDKNLLVIQLGAYRCKIGPADHLQVPKYIPSSYNGQPIVNPKTATITDWDLLASFLTDIFVNHLRVNRAKNDRPVFFIIPSSIYSKKMHEAITQVFFERINVPALYIGDEALMSCFGMGLNSGLVLDFGHSKIDVTPIIDCQVYRSSRQSVAIGGEDIEKQLLKLLAKDDIFMKEFGGKPDIKVARAIKESGIVEVLHSQTAVKNLNEMNSEKQKSDIRAEFEYEGKKYSVGSARLLCCEVLFKAKDDGLSLAEAMSMAVTAHTEPEKRLLLWETIIIAGGLGKLSGLRERLSHEVLPFIAASETSNEYQCKEIKFSNMPEYFTVYKDALAFNESAFLGGAIVSKIVFPDSKSHITKGDYNEMGPASCYLKIL